MAKKKTLATKTAPSSKRVPSKKAVGNGATTSDATTVLFDKSPEKPMPARKPAARTTVSFNLEAIGDTAGQVWHLLHEAGEVPLSTIKKKIDAPADMVTAALGWLAREGKLAIDGDSGTTTVKLCE